MNRFHELLQLEVSHQYYADSCRDFQFLMPEDTAQLLRNGRLVAKDKAGGLQIVFEGADRARVRVVSAAGEALRVGLKLNNPYFSNPEGGWCRPIVCRRGMRRPSPMT